MSEKIFPNGFLVKEVDGQYGKFYGISIRKDEFIDTLEKYVNENGYVNINIYFNREGAPYSVINTYKANSNKPVEKKEPINMDSDDLPF